MNAPKSGWLWGRWVRSSGASGLVLEKGREVASPALLKFVEVALNEGGGACGGEGDFEFVACVAATSNEGGGCVVRCEGVEDLYLVFDACVYVGGSC